MSWFSKHVYDYCEQGHSPGFWSQPANAVTNIAYILGALLIWRMLQRERRAPFSIWYVVPLALIIGVGSFLFHTMSNQASELLDRVPIELFVLSYLVTFLHWFYGLSWKRSLLGLGAFIIFTIAFIEIVGPSIPNQSGQYVPALLLLIGLTFTLAGSGDRARSVHWRSFALAGVSFALALVARSVDENVCGDFPLGTHFIWHLLTALLLYIVSRSLILRWRAVTALEAQVSDETDDVGVPS